MKNIDEFNSTAWPKIEFVLTDIDDTLTNEGLLHPEAYSSLWDLKKAGIHVIPVTGRPAGWCELIARQWPVAGVIGENGGFYFNYAHSEMQRWYALSESVRNENQKKLQIIQQQILKEIPESKVASDQFCRQMDLAIDFCEDIPRLSDSQIQRIVEIFQEHGATAKVSSIHVNGWFGQYNKVTTAFEFLKNKFNLTPDQARQKCIFVGDSPNDEPMFQDFPLTFGVSNVLEFANQMKHKPQFYAHQKGGAGFREITEKILNYSN